MSAYGPPLYMVGIREHTAPAASCILSNLQEECLRSAAVAATGRTFYLPRPSQLAQPLHTRPTLAFCLCQLSSETNTIPYLSGLKGKVQNAPLETSTPVYWKLIKDTHSWIESLSSDSAQWIAATETARGILSLGGCFRKLCLKRIHLVLGIGTCPPKPPPPALRTGPRTGRA